MNNDTRSVNIIRAHELVEPFLAYANEFKTGYCKSWKAIGILVTVAEIPNCRGDRLVKYVRCCLEMEGFRTEDCEKISAWIEEKF